MQREEIEELPLSKAAEYLLDECRMVLPGLQALFGFQLIAVFNQGFVERLTVSGQRWHLVALALVAVAVVIVMTPAAYHRQTGPRVITETFVAVSTRLLLWSMLPLAAGIMIDFALIARIMFESALVALVTSILFSVFFLLWFALPRATSIQRVLGGGIPSRAEMRAGGP
jgi:hypothetical protein